MPIQPFDGPWTSFFPFFTLRRETCRISSTTQRVPRVNKRPDPLVRLVYEAPSYSEIVHSANRAARGTGYIRRDVSLDKLTSRVNRIDATNPVKPFVPLRRAIVSRNAATSSSDIRSRKRFPVSTR